MNGKRVCVCVCVCVCGGGGWLQVCTNMCSGVFSVSHVEEHKRRYVQHHVRRSRTVLCRQQHVGLFTAQIESTY